MLVVEGKLQEMNHEPQNMHVEITENEQGMTVTLCDEVECGLEEERMQDERDVEEQAERSLVCHVGTGGMRDAPSR